MESATVETGTTEAHHMASKQDYGLLMKILEAHEEYANAKDKNGWTPLHEAVVGNSEAIVELLVEKGSDVNAVTNSGETALNIAKEYKGEGHPIVTLLESYGAKMGSEL
jgi:ankyrin repeat protein